MYDLSWGTAIVGGILFAAGLGLEELGKFLGRNLKSKMGAILIWPCRALGFVLMGAAVVVTLWNMIGPIVLGY